MSQIQMTTSAAKTSAVQEIRRLVEQHDLVLADIHAIFNNAGRIGGDLPMAQRSRTLVRVLSYIGGIFVFTGIAAFVAMQWGDMNSVARVAITLGPGLAAFVLGVIALKDSRYEAVATPLFIGAAFLEPIGLIVALSELTAGIDWRLTSVATAATIATQYGLTFFQLRRTVLALFAVVFGIVFCCLGLDRLGADAVFIGLIVGATAMFVGIAAHRSAHAAISPVLFLFGSWYFLWALFDWLEGGLAEILFLAAACSLVWVGVAVRSRTLNFTSTIAILTYTGYFTNQHFADSIGWPLALIMFGSLMIGISSVALKIDRQYLR